MNAGLWLYQLSDAQPIRIARSIALSTFSRGAERGEEQSSEQLLIATRCIACSREAAAPRAAVLGAATELQREANY